MPKLKFLPILVGSMVLLATAQAQNEPPPASPIMREVSPGVYEIGQLRLDEKARIVTFPREMNMNTGKLENLRVTEPGNLQDSLLAADVTPNHLDLPLLLPHAKRSG